jgi:hypothetical protein
MKRMMGNMKKQLTALLTIIFLLTIIVTESSFSQEKSTIRPTLILSYVKTNGAGSLAAKLSYAPETTELPLTGREIIFYTTEGKKELGKVSTDMNGSAILKFSESEKLPADAQGNWAFSAEFGGNDTIDAASAEVTGRDVILDMTLSLVDSVKTVSVSAYTYDGTSKTPVAGEVVTVSVPRMFSYLPIGDITLDDNGTGSIEFPSDIPGDSTGYVTVVGRFFEHPSFSTVESRIAEKWGIPTHYSLPSTHRALWTKTPPTWMIITLSILLAGVWGHYMFAVISLILIRIDAKRKQAKEEYRL